MKTRKFIRLEKYDYSQNGTYFITVCVKDRQPILSEIKNKAVGASIARPPEPQLTELGTIVENAIKAISVHYPEVSVDNYVIMPDHIHLILRIERGRAMLAPTGAAGLSEIVRQMKGVVTKQCGKAIWQKSFYDHVIRNEQDYADAWQYIDGNPARWYEKH